MTGRLASRGRRRGVLIVSVASALVVLAGCSNSTATNSQSPASGTTALKTFTFRTEYLASGIDAPYLYALSHGYYKAEGLDFKLSYGKGSLYTAQDVGQGRSDGGDVSSGVAALAIAKGLPITVVGAYSAKSEIGFIVPKDSSITSIKDLAGKTVVTETGAPEELLLPAVWQLAGIPANSVHLLVVSAAIADSTYASGKGDAISESLPFGLPLVEKQRPSRVLPWADIGFVMPGYSFIVNKSLVQSDPAEVAAFLRATYKGLAGAMQHPAEAADLVMKANSTLDAGEVAAQWTGWIQYICTSAMKNAGEPIGYNDVSDWQSGLQLLAKYQGLTGSTNPADYVTNTFFSQGNPVSTTKC